MKTLAYIVKSVYKNKWAVINVATGQAQSIWASRAEANAVAKDLNRPLILNVV